MKRLRLGSTLVLAFAASSCHLPTAADLLVCKHATLSAHLSGAALLSHSADLKQFTLDFGVISGTREEAVWTLDNPGTLEVTVLKVVDDVDPTWNVAVQQGQSIPPHGHLDLSVTFMPPSTGAFTHSLSIVTDSCILSSVGLTLKGAQVATPALLPSDTLIEFGPGPTASRSQRDRIVTLSNISDIDLTVKATAVVGAQASAFSAFASSGGGDTLTVKAGQTAGLNIRFSPNMPGMFQHYEASMTISYCLDGCTTVLNLQADSYECLDVEPPWVGFDGGTGQGGLYVNFNQQTTTNNVYLCTHAIQVGIQTDFLNQLPDGGPADGGPFSLDPWVVDGGLYVYFGGSGLAVNFAPIDNLEYQGTLSLSYSDPLPYSVTVPMFGHASCLVLTQNPYFSAYASSPKDAQTAVISLQNRCSATNVKLTAAPMVWNLLDGGLVPDGPFQSGTGAPAKGTVVAPGATLYLPISYAPIENRNVVYGSDLGQLTLETDEPNDNPTSLGFYGQGYGPNLYIANGLDFTSFPGVSTTQSTYIGNYSNDYPGHAPNIVGVATDCVGMSAALDGGLPAPVPYGQWYYVDATWSPPACDGGRCGCDGGSCQCSITLQTTDIPLPPSTIAVYY